MKAIVNTPFKLSKKDLTMWEYLEEVIQKYEEIEDLMLLKLIKEWENTKNISTDDFYEELTPTDEKNIQNLHSLT